MTDKNIGERAPAPGWQKAGKLEMRGNRGQVIKSRRTILRSADEVKRATLICAALLGAVFTGGVCADTDTSFGVSSEETTKITVQIEQPVVISPASEVITTAGKVETEESDDSTIQERNINTAFQSDQPRLGQQAILQVANLGESYDKQRDVVENTEKASGKAEESSAGLPYAVLLIIVALIALVPVARRNGHL